MPQNKHENDHTKMETRYLPFEDIEMRVETDDDGKSKLSGYAAVFNRDSVDLGGFIERIMPEAFKESLKSSDVRALFNHNPDHVLGRNTAGTLRMAENSKGLKFEVDLPDTQIARDVATSVERGDISGCSFSFTTREDVWRTVDGQEIRELIEIDTLFDVGPVSFPAYPDTTVAARSDTRVAEMSLKDWLSRKDDESKVEEPAPGSETTEQPEDPAAEPEVPADDKTEEPAKETEEKSTDAMAENRKVIDQMHKAEKDSARAQVDLDINKHMSAS